MIQKIKVTCNNTPTFATMAFSSSRGKWLWKIWFSWESQDADREDLADSEQLACEAVTRFWPESEAPQWS